MIRVYIAAAALMLATLTGYKVADWQWSEKYANHLRADAEANYKAIAEVQEKQLKLNQELEHAYQAAEQLQDKHQAELASANSAAERMRQQLDRIKTMPAIGNSSTVAERAASATDARVLAVLLEQSDRLAGIYAAEADSNRIAAMNCTNEYNAVLKSNNQRGSK